LLRRNRGAAGLSFGWSRRALLMAFAPLLRAAAAESQWLDVPFVQQTRDGCGSAAIAMVVQYWARRYRSLDGAAADTERINRFLPATPAKGIQGAALKKYLEDRGFNVYVFTGELNDLEHHLEKGRPLVVCLGLKGSRAPLHYAVVAGMDRGSVRLNDPARGKLIREDRETFLAAWKVTENWVLLAVPRRVP
jgi:predicted double-glycine peptidase